MASPKTISMITSTFGLMKALLSMIVEAITGTIRIFSSAADTPAHEEEPFSGALAGGNFNHRTQQFDDGTDPVGWYSEE